MADVSHAASEEAVAQADVVVGAKPAAPQTERATRVRSVFAERAERSSDKVVPVWTRHVEQVAAYADSAGQEALASLIAMATEPQAIAMAVEPQAIAMAAEELPQAWTEAESVEPVAEDGGVRQRWRQQQADSLRALHTHLLRLHELLTYAPDERKRLRVQLQQATACSQRSWHALQRGWEAEEKQRRARQARTRAAVRLEAAGAVAGRTAAHEAARLRAELAAERKRSEVESAGERGGQGLRWPHRSPPRFATHRSPSPVHVARERPSTAGGRAFGPLSGAQVARGAWEAREAALSEELQRATGSARRVAEQAAHAQQELSSQREIAAELEARSQGEEQRLRVALGAAERARLAGCQLAHARQAEALRRDAEASCAAASEQQGARAAWEARWEEAQTQLAREKNAFVSQTFQKVIAAAQAGQVPGQTVNISPSLRPQPLSAGSR